MSRRQEAPLRALTAAERAGPEQLSRGRGQPAAHVARAGALLAVAGGRSYTDAARRVGRRSGGAVAHLVARLNRDGLAAVAPGHGGGSRRVYGASERERVVAEARRPPDRERDGTATWSLSTLRRALRRAEGGLPGVSTYTIWCALHEADLTWQRDRSWCHTGRAMRRRTRDGVALEVEVRDPDAAAKKA